MLILTSELKIVVDNGTGPVVYQRMQDEKGRYYLDFEAANAKVVSRHVSLTEAEKVLSEIQPFDFLNILDMTKVVVAGLDGEYYIVDYD